MKLISEDEMMKKIAAAWKNYEGDVTVLASAIGALYLGRRIGWQGVRVMYSRVTFNKYENILGVKFRDVLPKRGPESRRLAGIRIVDNVGKFWQAISGGFVSAREGAQTA